MKKLAAILVVASFIVLLSVSLLYSEEINWKYTYKEALEEAKELDKNIFVLITAPSWCGWCVKLENETLSDEEVIEIINDGFIALKVLDVVNGKRNPDLSNFNYSGFPNMLFYNTEGKQIDKVGGYVPASSLIPTLNKHAVFEDVQEEQTQVTNVDANEILWIENYKEGMKKAKESNKQALILVTAPSWCGWCIKLEDETLSNKKVIDFVNNNFIPIKILDVVDGVSNPDLNYVNISGYPSIQIANSDGEIIINNGGYLDVESFIENGELAIDYEKFFGTIEKDIENSINDPEKMESILNKLAYTYGNYEKAIEYSGLIYDNTENEVVMETALFYAFVSHLFDDQLEKGIELSEIFIEDYPASDNIDLVKYYKILALYYLGKYDDSKKEAESYLEDNPNGDFIEYVKEIIAELS